ncbi:uncharacterized protein LOC128680395 [Plodia interpunctella]|uniref:uncharacterized protein LOC128680395 n=1 Tax=Plodia interpunctella TaxID=58824 RepID=UPI002368A0B6|nr:uncharacterized protein LOC128680395 [Plodia interpunctella]
MSVNIILFLVFCSSLGLCRGQGGGGAGAPSDDSEYILIFESSIFPTADEESLSSMNTSGLEVVSFNETISTISGVMWILKELPESHFRIVVIVKKEVSGKFEVVLTKEICDLCEELHVDSEHWKYIRYFGLPPQCPFPPGIYTVNGFAPHEDDLPLNSGSAARYIITIMIYHNKDGDCDNYDNQIYLFSLILNLAVEAL